MNKYEKKCFEHFKKLRNHDDCRIRFVMTISKFFITMTMTNYLTLIKTLIYLDSF